MVYSCFWAAEHEYNREIQQKWTRFKINQFNCANLVGFFVKISTILFLDTLKTNLTSFKMNQFINKLINILKKIFENFQSAEFWVAENEFILEIGSWWTNNKIDRFCFQNLSRFVWNLVSTQIIRYKKHVKIFDNEPV